ncbi:Carrier domain-containing protein [Bordetella sputigena]|uniref:amino acid adenylation domain-containing protein n=1 Tax=Bordetella sputigena TaxID=1416810 RepID=UPI0039EDF78C
MDPNLARRVAAKFMALGPAQRRAAYRQMRETGMDPAQLPILPRDTAPVMSHAQRRLWFLWRMDPTDATYHLPGALRLKGDLDEAAVHAALQAVRGRHAALRMRFAADADGLAAPVVDDDAAIAIDREDLRAVPQADREARAADVARAWLRRPFDLTTGPLLRAGLLRLDDDEHLLVIVMHHIVSDGWSVRLVMTDFAAAYAASLEQGAARLPAAPAVAYTDYAAWQADLLDAGEQERQLAYWREALGDEHGALQLPHDHAPQAGARVATAVDVDLDGALAASLRALARERGDTIFMLLLAGFQALLHRYTGRDDIRVGVPAAGRHRGETQDVVGLFVNTQVLAARFDAASTFEDAIGRARAAVLGAQAHPDLPFDSLVDALRPERGVDQNPLFQVLFNHQQSRGTADMVLPGLACATYPLGVAALPVDLQCDTVEYSDGRIAFTLRYAGDRYAEASMRRLAAHYVAALTALSRTPRMRLVDAPLLSAEERDGLRAWSWAAGWGDASGSSASSARPLSGAWAEVGRDQPVHAVIAAQARRTPDAVAVCMAVDGAGSGSVDGVDDSGISQVSGRGAGLLTLTYAELERQSNRLAHRLLSLGVGPERRVAIAAYRHPSLVVSLLAVLKTGAAYVPLDPEYPDDRLAYMMRDSAPALLLTQSWLSDRMRAWTGAVLEVDTLDLAGEPDHAPEIPVHAEQACYVIYTSGSTGKPKGATNRHAGLGNRIAWMQQAYGLGSDDVVLQKTPFSFDVSVWEFFWPLMAGARLALAGVGEHRDAERLLSRIVDHGVTTMHFVPSMLHAFVSHCESLGGGAPMLALARQALRRIYCSGEALPAELCVRFHAVFPAVELHNLYGPTEAAIDVTSWDCANTSGTGVPIGRPIAGLRTHVLDANLNEVPPGVAGELYLGGIGLGRGYLNRPALTADRFIADPFGTGQRLYRTGDLARWNHEGQLEYLGRLDHQIKLRGQRIELGEIEAQLLAQPGVKQAVVLAQVETAAGTPTQAGAAMRLVAYLTPAQLDTTALRRALEASLPAYMIPSAFVMLDALPVTANGKLDRKALPQAEFASTQNYEAPQGQAEATLAAIWREVLGAARIGRHDNFFELGGDSILSLQIVARLRQAGWRVSPRQMFERQSIAALAEVAMLEDGASTDSGHQDDAAADHELPLLPIQAQFLAQPLPTHNHWNQAVLLHSDAEIDIAALRTALAAVLAHHDAPRLRFHRGDDGQWIQTYADMDVIHGQDIVWDVTARDVAEIEAHCARAQASLDIANGPLLRAVRLRVADGSWRLLLVVHHLAIDGVSWRILLEDLRQAYGQVGVPLPARTASYGAWARHLRGQAPVHAAEAQYWLDQAAGDFPAPDHPDGTARVCDQRHIEVSLTRVQTQSLLRQAPAAYRTQVNDLLLASLASALKQWRGLRTVRIDLEGHGRETGSDDHHPHGIAASAAAPDITRTVGWFTAIYPVVLDTEGGLDQLIRRTKEQLRATPCKGLGHGILSLWGDTSIREALAKAPQAPILFNYLGQFDADDGSSTRARYSDGFVAEDDWRIAAESAGPGQYGLAPLSHALTINGRVYGPAGQGRLSLDLGYSGEQWTEETMRDLAACWTSTLSAMIAHCSSGAQGVTPSDFPLARLTQAGLDGLPIPGPVGLWQDIYPVTPMQAGMLFHSAYGSDATQAYVNQLRVDVHGLDPARFRAAWESAVARHDVLRTGFVASGGEPLQWVARQVRLPFEQISLQGSGDAVAAKLDALAAEQRAAGFDMAVPPLMRCTLVRVNGDYDHFIWTHHHLLLDGWSLSQLLGEILSEYAGAAVSRPAGKYRDYLRWLALRDVQASQAYWTQQLRMLETPTLLADAMSGSRNGGGQYGVWTRRLDDHQVQALTEYAGRERVTMNTLAQAAWSLVLSLHTGQDTVAFGSTTSGRPDDLPGVQRVLGLYINTLPVLVQLPARSDVGSWLRSLQEFNVAAREHEHTPLYEIQRRAGHGGQALFDTLVVFENYPVDQALSQPLPDGARFSGLVNTEQTSYPLTLVVTRQGGLTLSFSYDRARYDDTAIEALGLRLIQGLRQLASGAADRLGTLTLLTREDAGMLRTWRAGECLRGALASWRDQPVHAVIAAQAARTPDAVAVCMAVDGAGSGSVDGVDGSGISLVSGRGAGLLTLTYAELERQSNRLAHRLLSLGVGPERRVAIAAHRHPSLVVSLLAVLKTGAAYVPLDPEYPDDRLAYMMRDSAPALLLTQSWLSDRMRAWTGAVLEVDTLDLSGEPDRAPEIPVHAEQACYVIYTSGSTGKPKGATNRHVGLGNRIAWMQQAYGLGSDDVVLQKTPFSFDVSVWEFFWPLMAGARLALAGVGEHRDAERLLSRIVDHGVTTMHFVPSMLHAFVSHCESLGGGANPGGEAPMLALARQALRRIYCSGEALPAELCTRLQAVFPAVELHNLYGPTEAAIDVTSWDCANTSGTGVPIGRPIAGLRTHVLDANLNEVPPGVAGELYLGGIGLGRGYLNRPALTADRFIADPFGTGQRLYRTGDLARWNHEGQLEYLGRLDHQIKLRGQRIELGEIEAQLLAQPGVKQAVVLAQVETAAGTPTQAGAALRLVAYVTPAELDTTALRRALEASLPAYMIPSAFVMLDALPVTANGKLDRKALPQAEFASTQCYEAPQGQAEATLAAIWREVLGATRIGRHDNFFELGGDSISVMQVFALLRQRHGVEAGARVLFDAPSIAALARSPQLKVLQGQPAARGDLAAIDSLLNELEM